VMFKSSMARLPRGATAIAWKLKVPVIGVPETKLYTIQSMKQCAELLNVYISYDMHNTIWHAQYHIIYIFIYLYIHICMYIFARRNIGIWIKILLHIHIYINTVVQSDGFA
jgi:hypothetical protein